MSHIPPPLQKKTDCIHSLLLLLFRFLFSHCELFCYRPPVVARIQLGVWRSDIQCTSDSRRYSSRLLVKRCRRSLQEKCANYDFANIYRGTSHVWLE